MDISGPWQSEDGLHYEFTQSGNHILLNVKNVYGAVVSSGEGSIAARKVELNYVLSNLTVGGLQLTVAGNGNEMRGTYKNVTMGLSGRIILSR